MELRQVVVFRSAADDDLRQGLEPSIRWPTEEGEPFLFRGRGRTCVRTRARPGEAPAIQWVTQ